MRAGILKQRISLQALGATQDATGAVSQVWTEVALLWAAVEPLTGRELIAAQATRSELTHKITIRYQAQFANPAAMAAMRILYNGRLFNIFESKDIKEAHRVIELMVTEGVNAG